jgi:molybdopterin molybdotransferase
MLDFDTAQLQLARAGTPPSTTETCALDQACGRVLAQTLFATLDLPPADNSAMDGYAIAFADYAPGRKLPVQQRSFAGEQPVPLIQGQATRLFTGSLIPAGADTVIMQENADEHDGYVLIKEPPAKGDHVRKQGEDVARETQLLAKGTLLGPGQIALLASQGYGQVQVYPVIKVGILTTGDELVMPGQPRANHQIFDSNGVMLGSLLARIGAHVVQIIHARDTEESLKDGFTRLLATCDLVLTIGGVSVGEKDLVKPVLESLGGSLDLWKVCMKPGKPVALARAQGKPVVCLPGNPVSAFVVYSLLVTPLIRTMQGRESVMPAVHWGVLDTSRHFLEKREEFLRVQLHARDTGLPGLEPYPQQGSNIISALAWADGLARVTPNTKVTGGSTLRYYPLSDWLT